MGYINSYIIKDKCIGHIKLQYKPFNTLVTGMLEEILIVLKQYKKNEKIKLVLITSDLDCFSFGSSILDYRETKINKMLRIYYKLIREIFFFPKLTCSIVHGYCLGSGFELALACNFFFIDRNITIGFPGVKYGIIPNSLNILGKIKLDFYLRQRLLLTSDLINVPNSSILYNFYHLIDISKNMEEFYKWYDKYILTLPTIVIKQNIKIVEEEHNIYDKTKKFEKEYLTEISQTKEFQEGIYNFINKDKS